MIQRQRLEQQKADLLRQSKAQQKQVSQSARPRSTATAAADHLHDKAATLAARQQQQAADRRKDQQAGQTDKLTIGGIRGQPGMTPEVEQLLASLQSLVPTLARAATAPSATGSSFQPAGVLGTQQPVHGQARQVTGGDEYDTEFVYNPERGMYVKVVHSPARDTAQINSRPANNGLLHGTRVTPKNIPDSEDETSADEDCPVEPPAGYRLVWRRDAHGEKYSLRGLSRNIHQRWCCHWYVMSQLVAGVNAACQKLILVGASMPRWCPGRADRLTATRHHYMLTIVQGTHHHYQL